MSELKPSYRLILLIQETGDPFGGVSSSVQVSSAELALPLADVSARLLMPALAHCLHQLELTTKELA